MAIEVQELVAWWGKLDGYRFSGGTLGGDSLSCGTLGGKKLALAAGGFAGGRGTAGLCSGTDLGTVAGTGVAGVARGTEKVTDLPSNLVLNGVSLVVQRGQILCLTGPNGSGKSTLMKIISGNRDSSLNCMGTVLIDGKEAASYRKKDFARKLAFLTQNEESLWNYTVRDTVLMGRYCHTGFSGFYTAEDYKETDSVIQMVGIEALAERKVFELSGGEYQKVRIARCLAQKPDYLLLDEPVANLDFGYEKELLCLLKKIAVEQNMGIMISIHDLNSACRFADRIALLPKRKECISGSVEEVMNLDNLAVTYPGVEFGSFVHPHYGCPQVYTL